jgi:hypothetical protein
MKMYQILKPSSNGKIVPRTCLTGIFQSVLKLLFFLKSTLKMKISLQGMSFQTSYKTKTKAYG